MDCDGESFKYWRKPNSDEDEQDVNVESRETVTTSGSRDASPNLLSSGEHGPDEDHTLNPFNVPNIIAHLMEYMSRSDLVSARLVNKTWELEANKFVPDFEMVFSGNVSAAVGEVLEQKSLPNLVLDANSNPKLAQLFQCFKLRDFHPSSQPLTGFLQIFGPNLFSLTLTASNSWEETLSSPNPGYLCLYTLLSSTPTLKYLFLDSAMWSQLRWAPTQIHNVRNAHGPDDLKFEHGLKTFVMMALPPPFREQGTPAWTSIWATTGPILAWKSYEFWTVLLNVVKTCQNLSKFSFARSLFVPEPILRNILAELSPNLKILRIGEAGEAHYAPNGELVKQRLDYLSLFAAAPKLTWTLKTLSFPRPEPENQGVGKWTTFFSKVSSSLTDLEIGGICDFWPRDTRISYPIQLKGQLILLTLTTLTIPIGMFSPKLNGSTFPSLRTLTLDVDKIDQLLEQFSPDSSEHEYKCEDNLSNLRSLTCRFINGRKMARYTGIRRMFEALKHFMPNIQSVELVCSLGLGGLAAFFEVFGAQDSQTAEKIQVLRLECFGYWGGHRGQLNAELNHILTGVLNMDEVHVELQDHYFVEHQKAAPRNSLRSFKNLHTLFFGLGSEDFGYKMTRHFVLNSICHLEKLNSLEFEEIMIEKDALDELNAIPRLKHLKYSKCLVINE